MDVFDKKLKFTTSSRQFQFARCQFPDKSLNFNKINPQVQLYKMGFKLMLVKQHSFINSLIEHLGFQAVKNEQY